MAQVIYCYFDEHVTRPAAAWTAGHSSKSKLVYARVVGGIRMAQRFMVP